MPMLNSEDDRRAPRNTGDKNQWIQMEEVGMEE